MRPSVQVGNGTRCNAMTWTMTVDLVGLRARTRHCVRPGRAQGVPQQCGRFGRPVGRSRNGCGGCVRAARIDRRPESGWLWFPPRPGRTDGCGRPVLLAATLRAECSSRRCFPAWITATAAHVTPEQEFVIALAGALMDGCRTVAPFPSTVGRRHGIVVTCGLWSDPCPRRLRTGSVCCLTCLSGHAPVPAMPQPRHLSFGPV